MKINSEQLLNELTALTQKHLQQVQFMQNLPDAALQAKPAPQSWNALACIEHLNRYALFYHPEIEKRINLSATQPDTLFKSGLLGNYFAEMMWPKEKPNKMKTFKSMNPVDEKLTTQTLVQFENQLQQLLQLLKRAKAVSLNKVKTAISITSLLQLKLGDTFRVIIYHNERHIRQAKRALEK